MREGYSVHADRQVSQHNYPAATAHEIPQGFYRRGAQRLTGRQDHGLITHLSHTEIWFPALLKLLPQKRFRNKIKIQMREEEPLRQILEMLFHLSPDYGCLFGRPKMQPVAFNRMDHRYLHDRLSLRHYRIQPCVMIFQ